jgi:hypothetical protein
MGYSIGKWIDEDGNGRYNVLEVETRHLKGPRALDPAGTPTHVDNKSIVKERIFFGKSDAKLLHNEITLIDNALTRPWTVLKTYRRVPAEYPEWSEDARQADNVLINIGKETYYKAADGNLMPTRKGQSAGGTMPPVLPAAPRLRGIVRRRCFKYDTIFEADFRRVRMAHFSIGHVLRLRDGMYAVRSLEYPSCEGYDAEVWPAREQFRQALSEHVRQMIQQGEVPPSLYLSLEEAQSDFGAHCRVQISAPDRLPKTFDYAMIVEVDLPPDDVERFAAIRIGKLLPETRW